MTSAQVVETSVNVTLNSPSQDYTHPDDCTPLSYDISLYCLLFALASMSLLFYILGEQPLTVQQPVNKI